MIDQIKSSQGPSLSYGDAASGQKVFNRKEVAKPVVTSKQEVGSAREEIPREEVERASEKLNRLIGIMDKRLESSIDGKSGREVVKIIDKSTGEVINQFPAKQLIDFLGSFRDLIGLLLDKHV